MHGYITNALIAGGIAVLISLAMGPFMIPFLTRLKVGQSIRAEGPQRHYAKAGTPTMGGVIIITAVMVASFITAGASAEVLTAVLVFVACGAIGFWDDYIKVVLKRSLGLRARDKLVLQLIIGLALALLLLWYFHRQPQIVIPFIGTVYDLGILYIPFLICVLMGSTNGVNLTDGLDGLAAGVTFFVVIALVAVCFMTKHYNLIIFCGSLAGACVGFLVFNRHPARVFMGDTGSMAIGGGVAAVAALCQAEIALVIIGGVYVLETLSVAAQVVSYQTTGKRILLMAPLHHHYELRGWPETKVVYFFWALSFVFTVIGLLGFRHMG